MSNLDDNEKLQKLIENFTEEELVHLRQMIVEDQRRKWAAKKLLTIATWLAAIIVGLTTSWEFIKKILKVGVGV